MIERHVFCGGLDAGNRSSDALHIDVNAALGSPNRVNLHIEDISKKLGNTIPDVLTDMLEIAAYVYSADQFTRRGTSQMSGMGSDWRRQFRFVVPVRKADVWANSEVRDLLVETLNFLSEDEFEFDFRKSTDLRPIQAYLPFNEHSAQSSSPDEIILFSGGLDSLAGTTEAALSEGKRVALVSHRASKMIASKQNALVKGLGERAATGALFHVPVSANTGNREATEFTQRTRSFLFATLAFIVARMFERNEISFYENGSVSINLPIAEHVLGVRASRTTHPRFLADCARLFSALLSGEFKVRNPYLWKTKSEVISVLANSGCADMISQTISCTRVRQTTATRQQCGLCSQCIDRRFGILAAGLGAHDPPQNYVVDVFEGDLEPGPGLTMVESYVERAERFANMSESTFMAQYGQIFRVLTHLPGSQAHNAKRIWELHRRHGREVTGVIDHKLSGASIKSLPRKSLMAMVVWPHPKDHVFNDPIESEPTAAAQAEFDKHDYTPQRIALAIDLKRLKALFDGGVEFGGSTFALLAALAEIFEADMNAGIVKGEYRFSKVKFLADRLGVEEQTVRQHVSRARKRIDKAFLTIFDRTLACPDRVVRLGC